MFFRRIGLLLKAQISSLFCTIIDFVMTAMLIRFVGMWYVIANALGAVSGGILNCHIGYHYVFQGTEQRKYTIFRRYIVVWFGSVILNTAGTALLVSVVSCYGANEELGIVMKSKTVIAVLVAIFWNYLMQKKYVYER